MTRLMTALLTTVGLIAIAGRVDAQTLIQTGRVELSLVPATGLFFTANDDANEPGFGNYGVGGALAVNFNRYVGVEGEIAGALGVSQSLDFTTTSIDRNSPDLLQFNGNVVVSAPTGKSVVPYVTGGLGGLSLFEEAALGINSTETFLTGNVGGGVKWYAGRWGLRGDYRFITTQSKDDAPEFFGKDTRYGHRVYGAVFLNLKP